MKSALPILTYLLCLLLLSACGSLFNKKQPEQLAAPADLQAISNYLYNRVLLEQPLTQNYDELTHLRRVGKQLALTVPQLELPEDAPVQTLQSDTWEFNLVDNALDNSWLLYGGKFALHTELEQQPEIAKTAVMAHLLAHVLLGHNQLRLEQSLRQHGITQPLNLRNWQQSAQLQHIFANAWGLQSTAGYYPYSPEHERQADDLAIQLLQKAGLSTNEAVIYWLEGSSGQQIYKRIHPGYSGRQQQLEVLLEKWQKDQ